MSPVITQQNKGPVQKGALLLIPERNDHQHPLYARHWDTEAKAPPPQVLAELPRGGRTSKQPTTNHYKLSYVL